MTQTATTDSNAREAAIDTHIAETFAALVDASIAVDRIEKSIAKFERGSSVFHARMLAEQQAELPAAQAAVAEARVTYQTAEEAYDGWDRFFLVQNSNGHIHSSMACSSCNPTTRFAWLTDMSALTEAQAVEAHGQRLCTVCFPSAPVEWTEGYYTDQKAAAKAERAAAKQAKAERAAAKAAKRAETFHYFVRFTRTNDGTVIEHTDSLTTLKAGSKSAANSNASAMRDIGLTELVDANTGEVVA